MNDAETRGYNWALKELKQGASVTEVENQATDSHPFDRGAQWAIAEWEEQKNE